jgi:hypothetical protein
VLIYDIVLSYFLKVDMDKSKDAVLSRVKDIRENALDYFIPIKRCNRNTEAKKEISNLTRTLFNRVPLVKSFVQAASNYPVYVGYDGLDLQQRTGSYMPNVIHLHQASDDDSLNFIQAYTHELTHMDQDRRGLLRIEDTPPESSQFVPFIVHNLCLEAAALATEVTCIYHLSEHSVLRKKIPEVSDYFNDYVTRSVGRDKLVGHVLVATENSKSFDDLKPVWRSVFQAFFEPDSVFLKNYINDFCNKYHHKLDRALESDEPLTKKSYGSLKEIKQITTLPGWGSMFGKEGLDMRV